MGTRGVWSLENLEIKKPQDDWVDLPNVWISQYDIAHSRPYPAPNLQRWNLGTATMSNSTLSCSRYWGQASGNTTVSYFAGGGVSPGMTNKTTTDKLSYSPYTLAATPTANLTNAINRGGASSSNLAAYFSTGYPTGSWVDKILFATDTKSTLSDDFGTNYMTFSSLADGAGGGYLFEANVSQSKTFKITYSTDGIAHLPGSNLVNYTTESNGEMMSRTAGYKSGGAASSPAASSLTNKLSYSNTTWSAVPGGKLPIAKRRAASGTGRSKGFVGGGDLNVAPVYSDFALLDFSTDTFAQEPSLNFSPASYGYYPNKSTTTPLDGLYGADKAGDRSSFWSGDTSTRWIDDQIVVSDNAYFQTPSPSNTMNKIDMATDTASSLDSTRNVSQYTQRATGGNKTRGYMAGGNSESRVSKFTYSTETGQEVVPGGQMTQKRRMPNGIANDTQSYFSGGFSHGPGPVTNISSCDKMVHSSESCSVIPALNSYPGGKGSGSGNQTVGYWVNGLGSESRIYKVTYATDTGSSPLNCASPFGGRYNANFGGESPTANYCIGGQSTSPAPGYPNADRYSAEKFPFATETSTKIPGADTALTSGAYRTSGAGKDTKGYVVLGNDVEKFDYATDTRSGTFELPQSTSYGWGIAARRWLNPIADPPTATPTNTTVLGTTPAPDVGYFTGGPHYSSTDKLNFTNDTMAAGAQMATPRYNHVCWGNGTNFLDAGGTIASGADRDSRIEKITLSNNTVGTLPGANMPNKKRFFVGATGNDNIGYIAGGQTPSSPGTSSILKVTYASYTTDANPGCHLGANAYTSGAGGHGIGSPTAAYICAGMPSGSIGEGWHKIPYATNTATYSVVPSFNNPGAGRADDQSTGNKNKGYVTGYNPGSFSTSKTTEVVFATDTASNSTYSPNLGFALNRGATGNQTTGYFHGGLPSPAGGAGNDSYITKFVYSSDTISQLPASSKMTVPRTHCDAGSGVENSHNLSSNTALI